MQKLFLFHCFSQQSQWKFADTIGPQLYLKIEQTDDFFDVPAEEVDGDQDPGDPFWGQLMFHFFDDANQIIQDNLDDETGQFFIASKVFNNKTYWTWEN